MTFRLRLLVLIVSSLVLSSASFARSSSTTTTKSKVNGHVTESARAQKRMARLRHQRAARRHLAAKSAAARATTARATGARASGATLKTVSLRRRHARHRWVERFTASSFADDITEGDIVEGEDPIVRQAAVDALGNMNGTVVAIDPTSGRILAMVNQKLALSEGAQPCSTIKVAVALAGLNEKVITREESIALGGRSHMSLTQALAHSNNAYFETVGRRLGFTKVSYYAHQFGLGELAGYGIDGEHLGTFPTHELDASLGGVGKMCSFGESISMTPLQLGALVSAVANGGTLYYLQHPTSVDQVISFESRVKRQLDIGPLVPEIAEGMTGAVQYGTARSLRLNFSEEQILGKTGTCSKDGTRFGWFASYADTQYGHIVTVVFLQGGRPTYGPKAAEISGKFYRALYDHNFFAQRATTASGTPAEKPAAGVQQ
ncbi:MAG TPA: penicillin-binding transpeptidase domain-containing protein [Candidatus Polarisedimenticolia bacterium]|jgi:penicillin-binding protein 2|nr:penicillin-binding transpeptidase domain-containing protein [Candidatus Polarisedimenticolia bacterium]